MNLKAHPIVPHSLLVPDVAYAPMSMFALSTPQESVGLAPGDALVVHSSTAFNALCGTVASATQGLSLRPQWTLVSFLQAVAL
eukprot:3564468-Karenia_brevis.AAC.1